MEKGFNLIVAALATIAVTAACAFTSGHAPGQPVSCQTPFPIGFQVVPFTGGRSIAMWYPSDDAQATFSYSRDISTTLALNGRPLSSCGRFPLIVFSLGLGGCGAQSIFFTETLARQGYVVAAPDHADAAFCRVDGSVGSLSTPNEPSVFDPKSWTDTTYVDHKHDVELAISQMLTGEWGQISDATRIGVVGHSLGGYTALGVVGGWSTWKDNRIKAALLFSPYSLPFSINATLSGVHMPLMYQGTDGDVGITPFLEGPTGAYQLSNAPKYFVKLRGGNHFTWTNAICAGLINDYGLAFLNTYLKHQSSSLLTGDGSGLSAYAYQQ